METWSCIILSQYTLVSLLLLTLNQKLEITTTMNISSVRSLSAQALKPCKMLALPLTTYATLGKLINLLIGPL